MGRKMTGTEMVLFVALFGGLALYFWGPSRAELAAQGKLSEERAREARVQAVIDARRRELRDVLEAGEAIRREPELFGVCR
jgi:hypothetical protein